MPDYFDIVKKVEPENELEYSAYRSRDREIITLIKDFEIKGVISITKGQEFIHFIDANDSVPYHDLFLIDGKARILRMKDNEFLEYFKH